MDYVEFVRVRRVFIIFAAIFAVAAIVTVAAIHFASTQTLNGHVSIGVVSDTPHSGESARAAMRRLRIPLGLLLGIAGYCAVVFATILASSLNKENDGANFVFTKPISRERLALQYMAIDATGIIGVFALAVAVMFAAIGALGFFPRLVVDGRAFWIGALGLGIAFMWYGIMQAITAPSRGKGGVLVAWSWAAFAILTGLPAATFLGPAFVAIARAVNLFNPIAYFSTLTETSDHNAEAMSVIGLPIEPRVALAWCIALIACGLAIRLWKRVEI